MIIYFASLRLCVKLGSQSREGAKIRKDYICEKHSTTNLFCEMVLVTDSHIILYQEQIQKALSGYIVPLSVTIFAAEPRQQRISTTIGAKEKHRAFLERDYNCFSKFIFTLSNHSSFKILKIILSLRISGVCVGI